MAGVLTGAGLDARLLKAAGHEVSSFLDENGLLDTARLWSSPVFPETFLSGIGTLWLEGSRLGVVVSGVPGGFVLVGREPGEPGLDAASVVPAVDVAKQRRLRLYSCGESGCGPIDQLELDGRPQVFGEGVVEAVPDAPGRRGDAGIDQALGEPDRGVLAALISVKPA